MSRISDGREAGEMHLSAESEDRWALCSNLWAAPGMKELSAVGRLFPFCQSFQEISLQTHRDVCLLADPRSNQADNQDQLTKPGSLKISLVHGMEKQWDRNVPVQSLL